MLLLVAAVLTGLAFMHALTAPADMGGVPAATHGVQVTGGCAHESSDATDRHLDHRDAMCVAAGISNGYHVPALTAALDGGSAVRTQAGRLRGGIAAATGRAPPDLAQLQLLRI